MQANVRVVPGEVLYVDVGSNGANGRNGDGAGGGGTSALRLCPTRGSCPAGTDALHSRLAIAGGGGGAGGSDNDDGGKGGNGGDADNPGRDGEDSDLTGGGAGTTTTGGQGGVTIGGAAGADGALDSGGKGGSAPGRGDAGAGGAGGANGGGDGGEGSAGGPGGGGAGGGYNGGGGGGSAADQDAGAGGGGGGASWVLSSATNVQMSWSSARPSVTLTYTAAPTPPPPPPAPIVTGISPTSGPVTGGRTVTITGSNFAHTRRVLFGTTAAPRFALSGTNRLVVVTPPATSAGAVDVRVQGPSGLSALSPAARFTYTAQRPPKPRPGPTPPPTPAAECDVPNLIGAKLGRARRRLAQADCTVGKVRGPRRGRRVRVYRQSVGAGTHLVSDAPVDLWLRPMRRRR